MTHPFMSNAWFEAIVRIRDEVGELPMNEAIKELERMAAKIHDPEQYAKYAQAVRELAAKWDSRYIVRSRPVEVLEYPVVTQQPGHAAPFGLRVGRKPRRGRREAS